jgi:hypothetical protein
MGNCGAGRYWLLRNRALRFDRAATMTLPPAENEQYENEHEQSPPVWWLLAAVVAVLIWRAK